MKNVLAGALLFALVVSFWVQRDYRFAHTNLLPDATMVVLGVLSIWLVVRGWLSRATAEVIDGDDEVALRWAEFGRAAALLAAWVISLPWLGFVAGGILFATVTSVSMRTERPSIKRVSLDLLVNAAFVVLIYLAFTQVLYVRLPQFGGM